MNCLLVPASIFHLHQYCLKRYKTLYIYYMYYMLSCFSSVCLFATPWIVAHQAPLAMGFSRQEYWVAMPSSRGSSWPRDRTQVSRIAGRFFTAEPPGKPNIYYTSPQNKKYNKINLCLFTNIMIHALIMEKQQYGRFMVRNMYNIYSILYHIRKYWDTH